MAERCGRPARPVRLRSGRRVRAAVGLVAIAIFTGFIAGCAADNAGETAAVGAPRSAVDAAQAVIERPLAPGEDNGLEVVRWSVADREATIRRAVARHAVRGIPLGATADRLERFGLRAVVVRQADLPSMLADLGGTTTAVATWHGQVATWREIARVSLETPRVSMIDGRADALGAGWLRLMTRGWTVELEEGAIFDLQIAPQWIGDASDLSGLTNRDELRGRVFGDAAIHAELPRGTALLLLAAPPVVSEEDDPEGPPPAPGRSGGGRRADGPPGDLPQTPGELLLIDPAAVPPRRIVLILLARLPDALFRTSEPIARPEALPPSAPIPTVDPEPEPASEPWPAPAPMPERRSASSDSIRPEVLRAERWSSAHTH